MESSVFCSPPQLSFLLPPLSVHAAAPPVRMGVSAILMLSMGSCARVGWAGQAASARKVSPSLRDAQS